VYTAFLSLPLHINQEFDRAEISFAFRNSREIQRHDLSYFVNEPPSVAQGGKGVVVAGCPACRKRINAMQQFLDHLTKDAMPLLIDGLSTENWPT
jgi:hypothetical protein